MSIYGLSNEGSASANIWKNNSSSLFHKIFGASSGFFGSAVRNAAGSVRNTHRIEIEAAVLVQIMGQDDINLGNGGMGQSSSSDRIRQLGEAIGQFLRASSLAGSPPSISASSPPRASAAP